MPLPEPELDLTDVIEDAVVDSNLGETPEVTLSHESPEEVSSEGIVEAQEAVLDEADKETPEAAPKPSKTSALEDFDKKYGVDPLYPSGRENRIPYSRVKKIAQKAVKDARKEWESESSPRIQELETKVKDYEPKIQRYAQFEQILDTQPDKFLQMLSRHPSYTQIFKAIEQAFEAAEFYAQNAQAQPQAPHGQRAEDPDDMPQPDQQLSDGSLVYSMEGLRALNDWNRSQARKEVMKEVEEKFGPIHQEYEAYQRVEAVKPVVQQQIAEARTWELFNENEKEIVDVLRRNPRVSLEGAYRHVVFPKLKADREKLVADRNKIRGEVLQELQSAPRSTAVPSVSSKAEPSSEPKTLEEIIAESIKTLR